MSVLKRIATVLLIMAVLFSPSFADVNPLIITSEAHQGRTDSSGGHRDNKNKSGLGYYHYHCGGNPPHLHSDGVCPYSSSKTQSSSGTQSGSSTSNQTPVQPSVPDNISLVFNSTYYADNNSDLKQAYGTDYTSLLNHFLSTGMKEGRVACSTFNVSVYKENNADLKAAYGDDLQSYYSHFMNSGHSENRVAY